MRPFWALLAQHWPLAMESGAVEELLGRETLDAIRRSGIVMETVLPAGAGISCRHCGGGEGRVVRERGSYVGVCPEDCPVEELGPEPKRMVVLPGEFARRIAGLLELVGQPGMDGVVVPLGRRFLGEELVAVDLCGRVGRPGVVDAVHRLARGGPAVRIVLVPDSQRLLADLPARVDEVEVIWMGLDEVVRLGETATVDLRALLARRSFRGFTLPFPGLMVGEQGAAWHGVSLPIDRSPRARALLLALAVEPGAFVAKGRLWKAVAPEAFTRTGHLGRGENPDDLDQRLRVAVKELREAFRAVAGKGLPEEVVENRRGSETEGGYRLALGLERVELR